MRVFLAGRGRAGFTLIELLIVVVLVGVLSSVVIPILVGLSHKKPARPVASAAPHHAGLPPAAAAAVGSPPELERAAATIDVAVERRRAGVEVLTRYEARYRAVFRIRPAGPGPVRFEVPYPDGTVEARDVALRVRTSEGPREPAGVVYGAQGIRWIGPAGEAAKEVEVAFVTRGGEAFVYRLPRATRARAVDVVVTTTGAADAVVPDGSLQPTTAEGGVLRWHLRDLVSERPLQLTWPAPATPQALAMRLFELAGVAVLLFGAGFWYLGDLREPGRLDDFRWGQFLLLALTFCTFFVIVAVLEYHGHLPTAWSLALAGLTALPLLLLHVSRILGWRFAIRDVLPLALAAFGLVVTGTYGGPARDYVFLAAGVGALAFVTTTYPRWWAGRQRAVAGPEADEADAALAGPAGGGPAGHCLACGEAGADTPYCASCGTQQARRYACPHGHQGVVLPVHLLGAIGAHVLHCPACGDVLAAARPAA